MNWKRIGLAAIDFDGTIYRYGNDAPLYPRFAEVLEQLQASGGQWAACTGRTLGSVRNASRSMARSNVLPDYLLVRHWMVYSQSGGVWIPHLWLGLRIRNAFRTAERDEEETLASIAVHARRTFRNTRFSTLGPRYLKIQFDSEGDATTAAAGIREKLRSHVHIQVNLYRFDVELRVFPLLKGIAVRHLAEFAGVPSARVLAIGDGRSDLGMMVPGTAAMVGCPVNAKAEVIEYVMHRGGHIATKDSLAGVIEVLTAYAEDKVSSVPPEHWRPPSPDAGIGGTQDQNSPHRAWTIEIAMILTAALVGAFVVASVVFPGLSALLFRPLAPLFRLFVR